MFVQGFLCAGTVPGTVMRSMSFHSNYPVRHRMISYHLADVAGRGAIHQDPTQSVRGRADTASRWCGFNHTWPGFLPGAVGRCQEKA